MPGGGTLAKKENNAGLLTALKHPVRRAVLRRLRGGHRLSPRELAEALGLPLSNVSYHVRVLADNGAVRLVDEVQVRGSLQHFYVIDIQEPWALAVLDQREDAI